MHKIMFGGILIGIGIAALAFVIVWVLKKGNKPSIFTYIAAIAAVVVLSVESILMLKAIQAKDNTDRTVGLVQQTIMSYLPEQGQNYVITDEQASAINLALSIAVPSVADFFETEDLAGKSIMQITDTIRLSVDQAMSRLVRKSVWILVITSVVMTLLMYIVYNIGGSFGGLGIGSGGKASTIGLSEPENDNF